MDDKKSNSEIINEILGEHERTFLRLRIVELEEECDQLRAEVEHLKHQLYNRIPMRIESPEYNELKTQCEKLVNALQKLEAGYAGMFGTSTVSPFKDAWDTGQEIVVQALAEYREERGE